MPRFENSRLSPYEFDVTAESVQMLYTYGQPVKASQQYSGTIAFVGDELKSDSVVIADASQICLKVTP